ncbi:serine hydrolase domain-containing protein [Marinoscillum pacificum]|uniref:serine hydrolase domain-containing protein n=1 Tax=Marinoscillum pacificum TaxID=392723 RepID=UPI0021587C87|nr:serine hydrolase domain-containing protein [Marinoscillum pacificum]
MKKLICFMAVISLILSCQPSRQESTEEVSTVVNDLAKARLDSVLQSFVSDSIVAGVSALIIEKGEEAYFNAFGFADREAGVPMARNTIATIYSMTKPITGTTLMSLYEEGMFDLEDSLSLYLPEYANMKVATLYDDQEVTLVPSNRPITIADITRHTAGFSRRSDLGLDSLNAQADLLNVENTLAEMSTKLSELPLGYHPGTRWEYGISVDVQAYLAETLVGKPFAEYMQEAVLSPLKMTETGYYVPEDKRDRVAAIYYKTDSSLTRVPDEQVHTINYQHWPMTPGGWGLKSTIDDYMTFAQMMLNKGSLNGVTILQPETVELMATNHLPAVEDSLWLPSKGQVGFGIDFAVRVAEPKSAEENNGAVGEFYWDGAASTLFWIDPKNELTAVLFVQVFPFQGEVHKKFRDAVYGPAF